MGSSSRPASWTTTTVMLLLTAASVACNTRAPIRIEGSGEQRSMMSGPRDPLTTSDPRRTQRWAIFREFRFAGSSADIQTADWPKVSEIAERSREDPLLQFAIDRFDRVATDPERAALRDRRVDAIRSALIAAGVEPHRIRSGPFGDARLRSDERVQVLVGEGGD